MIFVLMSLSTKIITNLIYDKRLQLFAKDVSLEMTSFKKMRWSYIKCKPWVKLSICHYIRLLRVFPFFSSGLTI